MTDAARLAYRLGVDIGGTFTDAILIDEHTGQTWIKKVQSTPRDPAVGFLDATVRLLRDARIPETAVSYIVHGTTVVTNAIIEGTGARTGFITTAGFRDIFEMQRQMRPALYDLKFDQPKPLVPRYLALEVPERMDATGAVLRPLDEAAVRTVTRRLKAEGVESIAVCFLHGYLNGVHERRAAEIILDEFPEVALSISSDIAPEIREYFRACTTAINAAVRPVARRYLTSIQSRLDDRGITAELLVMQSHGGVLTLDAAAEKPVFLVESGPAAGVIAATHLGGLLGYEDVISFDMGGTTAKMGLTERGVPSVTRDYEIGSQASAGIGIGRGSGYPITTPVIDLVEIGSGGGSIAWVDSGGVLRVGPRSAGAEPGPACYGRGGTEPTVTDAHLVLGRLDPAYFLGGDMMLDVEAATQAIQERCAQPLGISTIEAANGIIEIANAAMVNALRLISVQRGYDPRDFVLVAFGGGGPLHANRLASELGLPRLLIPPSPGVFSALGLLVTDLKHDFAVTRMRRTDAVELAELQGILNDLLGRGRDLLTREGIAPEDMEFSRQVDIRYVGQSHALSVTLSSAELNNDVLQASIDRFHDEHRRAYGHSTPGEPTELVNIRLTATGKIHKPQLRGLAAQPADRLPAPRTRRQVYFSDCGGFLDCPVYLRYQLGSGATLNGPAIVEEMDATTLISPGYRASVDVHGNLLISPEHVVDGHYVPSDQLAANGLAATMLRR
jgi:N-methylhydantoinase A